MSTSTTYDVVIIGGGVIGLLAVQLAHLAGAEVMLLTRSAAKQNIGLATGAAHAAGLGPSAIAVHDNPNVAR